LLPVANPAAQDQQQVSFAGIAFDRLGRLVWMRRRTADFLAENGSCCLFSPFSLCDLVLPKAWVWLSAWYGYGMHGVDLVCVSADGKWWITMPQAFWAVAQQTKMAGKLIW
jgi:hypothetical protein